MSVDITDNPEQNRYEARVDGEPAGFIEYDHREDFTVLPHTEVDSRFRGRGVAAALTRYAVEDLHSQGRSIRPLCSYVVSWLDRHPEYAGYLHRP